MNHSQGPSLPYPYSRFYCRFRRSSCPPNQRPTFLPPFVTKESSVAATHSCLCGTEQVGGGDLVRKRCVQGPILADPSQHGRLPIFFRANLSLSNLHRESTTFAIDAGADPVAHGALDVMDAGSAVLKFHGTHVTLTSTGAILRGRLKYPEVQRAGFPAQLATLCNAEFR